MRRRRPRDDSVFVGDKNADPQKSDTTFSVKGASCEALFARPGHRRGRNSGCFRGRRV